MQQGGKTVYGASVGILMLETRFPRIPGDIGNALTWPFPVHYRVVRGATPDNVGGAMPGRLPKSLSKLGAIWWRWAATGSPPTAVSWR